MIAFLHPIVNLSPPFDSYLVVVFLGTCHQVLDISDCAITDADVSVMCRGLADARCRLRVLRLSGNVDISDRGASGAFNSIVLDFARIYRTKLVGFQLLTCDRIIKPAHVDSAL